MSILIQDYRLKRQERQFQILPPVFQAYQTDPEELDLNIVINKDETTVTGLNPVSLVGAAVTSVIRTNKPIAARKYNTVFNPDTEDVLRPLVVSSEGYLRVTGTTPTIGVAIGTTADLSSAYDVDGSIGIVVKSGTANQAFTLEVEDDSNNTSVYAMTTAATANTWRLIEARLQSGTGHATLDWSKITEMRVLCSGTVDIAQISVVKSTLNFIGKTLTLTIPCVSSRELEETLEVAAVMCNDVAEEMTATERTMNISLTTNQHNLFTDALFKGHVASNTKTKKLTNISNLPEVAAGVITLQPGLVIRSVIIEGAMLQKSPNAAQATADDTLYFYDTTTGLLTVSSNYNGKIPKVLVDEVGVYSAYSVKGVKTGYVGHFDLVSVTDSVQEQHKFKKCQLTSVERSGEDAADTVTYNFQIMIDNRGRYYEKIVTNITQ